MFLPTQKIKSTAGLILEKRFFLEVDFDYTGHLSCSERSLVVR